MYYTLVSYKRERNVFETSICELIGHIRFQRIETEFFMYFQSVHDKYQMQSFSLRIQHIFPASIADRVYTRRRENGSRLTSRLTDFKRYFCRFGKPRRDLGINFNSKTLFSGL